MKCFEIKTISFKHGIFDNCVDATYIIYLGNKVGIANIKKQLQKIKPTKKVFIYHNKELINCQKNIHEQNTNHNIIHNNIEIFKHSKKNKFKNILVLKDNFIFDRELIFKENLISINNFIHKNYQKKFMLSLGCLPILILPSTNKNMIYSIFSLGENNMIYSDKFQKYVLENENKIYTYNNWDLYLNYISNKYIFHKPLIYQKFQEIENQSNWRNILGMNKLVLIYVYLLKIQKNPKQAFKRHYQICILFNLSILIILIYIIYLLLKGIS